MFMVKKHEDPARISMEISNVWSTRIGRLNKSMESRRQIMEGNHSRLIQMKARGSDDWISDAIKEDSVEFEKQWFVDIDEEEI